MWKTDEEKEILRETIEFGSTSDGITKETFEMDRPVSGGCYESGC